MTPYRSALLVGAVVCLPFLGSVGLWDPWETHYAEVGRQMLERADLVHPWWEHAYFFSKPPLTPWLAAFGLFLSGAQPWGVHVDGPLPHHVEWFIRLPTSVLIIFAVAELARAVERRSSRRAALLVPLILWTMPLLDFVARQAMTDGPFLACVVFTIAFALEEKWFGAFFFLGLGCLAKGLLGGLPAVVLVMGWLLHDRRLIKRLPWWGPLISAAVTLPWYLAMARFDGRDDEGRHFIERFFFYDHFDRLVSGVHTTTPGGGFTYFIEQGAYAMAPWVFVLPLIFRRKSTPNLLRTTMTVSAAFSFMLFSASATRFHHYVLPVLPGIAVLLALELDALIDEALEERRVQLLIGTLLGALVWKDLWTRPRHFIDLFTYNQDRPYPDDVLINPVPFKVVLITLVVLALVSGAVTVWKKRPHFFVGTCLAFASAVGLGLSWHHWPAMGRHWTQRAITDLYFAERRDHEALGAFFMNWKGETFYSRNEVIQVTTRQPREALTQLVMQPGTQFVIVEHARLKLLIDTLPPGKRARPLHPELTNKFVLVAIDD